MLFNLTKWKQSFSKLGIFYLCQNFIFSCLNHNADFCPANVSLPVSKWLARYLVNFIWSDKYTWRYSNVWHSIFSMVLHKAVLKWLQSNAGWRTCYRREPIAPYCKIFSKSACYWSFSVFFCSLLVGLCRCRLSFSVWVVSVSLILLLGRFRSFLVLYRSLQIHSGCSSF